MFDQNKIYRIDASGYAITSLLAILLDGGNTVQTASVDEHAITVTFVKAVAPTNELVIKIPLSVSCEIISE